jgi:dihydropteroate synthase
VDSVSREVELAGVAVGGAQPVRLMAALNVSPESFYPGSVSADAAALRDAAQCAVGEGADWIDLGARSTAPYRDGDVPLDEEVRRLRWALPIVAAAVTVPISVDTTRAAAARAGLESGARLVNDVSGLHGDAGMAAVAAGADGVVLSAAPAALGGHPLAPPLAAVRTALHASLQRAAVAGIAASHIMLDPGIGFFASADVSALQFNLAVLRGLDALRDLELPLLVGVSRKRFIGQLSGREAAQDRLPGSLAAAAVAVLRGAAAIRTHDVAATRDAVRVAAALRT